MNDAVKQDESLGVTDQLEKGGNIRGGPGVQCQNIVSNRRFIIKSAIGCGNQNELEGVRGSKVLCQVILVKKFLASFNNHEEAYNMLCRGFEPRTLGTKVKRYDHCATRPVGHPCQCQSYRRQL